MMFFKKLSAMNYGIVFTGLLAVGLFGLVAYVPVYYFDKKNGGGENFLEMDRFLKIFMAVCLPGLVFSTINSLFFKYFLNYGSSGFLLFWAPRIIKETIMIAYSSYMMAILAGAMKRFMPKQFNII
jgi:hypothetical protein